MAVLNSPAIPYASAGSLSELVNATITTPGMVDTPAVEVPQKRKIMDSVPSVV